MGCPLKMKLFDNDGLEQVTFDSVVPNYFMRLKFFTNKEKKDLSEICW